MPESSNPSPNTLLINPEQRHAVVESISQSASAGFDFYLLVILSCSIATLGLITDSPAVIIGAMLVAPLMSPIIGIGLASITSNTNLLKTAFKALVQGAMLAIGLAALFTFVNNLLPFFSIQEIPSEVLSRVRPSPIDLVIALAGGIAAAYALTQPNISAALPGVAIATALMPPLCTVGIGIALGRGDIAGGAFLLFLTNAITIAFASALVFFLRGFTPTILRKNHRIPRSLVITALLTAMLLIPLTYFSIKFFREASQNRQIHTIVEHEVAKIYGAQLVDIDVNRTGTELDMYITIQTRASLRYDQVVNLQKSIVDQLQLPVSLKVNQIIAEYLDPLIPPTPTNTSSPTATPTVGPSPTITPSQTPTRTTTSSPTLTPTPSQPPYPTQTPLPGNGQITYYTLPRINLYQSPSGPVIGTLRPGQEIAVLYDQQIVEGLIWLHIMDSEGRIGWIPEVYVNITAGSIPTKTVTP